MWIPLIIGGTALFWYLGKEDEVAPRRVSPRKPQKKNKQVPESLEEYMVDKPSDWYDVQSVPSKVVKENSDYLATLAAYSSEDVWGVKNGNIFDNFRAGFKEKDPFILNCAKGVFLIDPQGYKYAKYACKVK